MLNRWKKTKQNLQVLHWHINLVTTSNYKLYKTRATLDRAFLRHHKNIFNFLQYICTQKLSLYNLYLVTMEDRMLVILLLRVDTASSFPSGSCSGMRLHSPSSFNTCCLLLHTRSTVDSTLNQVIIYQLTRKKHNPKPELIETQYSIINILLIFDVSLFP